MPRHLPTVDRTVVCANAESDKKSLSIFQGLTTLLPYLICALPPVALFFLIPPTFNAIDSAVVLTGSLESLIPHWPPLYPLFLFFNKLIFGYSDVGIYAIAIEQQVATVLASIYVMTALNGNWRRTLMASCLLIANHFYVVSHGIFTEALSSSLFLVFLGAALRLALQSESELCKTVAKLRLRVFRDLPDGQRVRTVVITKRVLAFSVYFIALYFMTMARHNMIVFASLLPCNYIFRFLMRSKGANFKAFLVTVLLGVGALFAVHVSNEMICRFLGKESTPLFGRVGVYRVQALPWERMKPAEKDELIRAVERRCPDDFCRAAFEIMRTDDNPWKGSYDKISALEPSFGSRKTANQAMNEVCKAFFVTLNKYLVQDVISGFCQYWGEDELYQGENSFTLLSVMRASTKSIWLYRSGKDILPEMRRIPFVMKMDPSQYEKSFSFLIPDQLMGMCKYFRIAGLTLGLCLVGALIGRTPKDSVAFCLAAFASLFLYSFLSALVTVVIGRYVAPVHMIVWIMVALVITSFRNIIVKAQGEQERNADHTLPERT